MIEQRGLNEFNALTVSIILIILFCLHLSEFRDGSIGWKKDLQAGNWRRRCDYTGF